MKHPVRTELKGFTLIELLIVIAIIAVLGGISMPVYSRMKEKAEMVIHVANVKNMTMHTLRWASDHSNTLPSPQYPGGHKQGDPAIPEEWDFAGTGSGLWLDGVVYYAAMFESHNATVEEKANSDNSERYGDKVEGVDGTNGNHLKGTIFFSNQSFKKDPTDTNNYHHSYAMNRSLQYDFLYAKSSDPELTNKNLARITFRPSALLFIENKESNVIGYEDIEAIIETGKERWSSRKVISSYLDGSARSLSQNEVPKGDVKSDREASRFWRGVDADSYNGQ